MAAGFCVHLILLLAVFLILKTAKLPRLSCQEIMSAGKATDPKYWLGQLEDVLCDRFENLGHQCAQIREEIVENISNVIRDSAERDEWDVCNFIWRLLDEWEAHGMYETSSSSPSSSTSNTCLV